MKKKILLGIGYTAGLALLVGVIFYQITKPAPISPLEDYQVTVAIHNLSASSESVGAETKVLSVENIEPANEKGDIFLAQVVTEQVYGSYTTQSSDPFYFRYVADDGEWVLVFLKDIENVSDQL